jgi:poly(A) polymerase
MLPIPNLAMPDFTIKPLLDGDEIAALRHIEPGPELGAVKRALLEAQIRGEVCSREDAETWVAGWPGSQVAGNPATR